MSNVKTCQNHSETTRHDWYDMVWPAILSRQTSGLDLKQQIDMRVATDWYTNIGPMTIHGHPWPSMAHLCHDKFIAPLRSNLDWFANWPWLHVGWKLMEFWWILSSNFFQLCALRVTACRACLPNKGDCLPAMPWHSFLLQLDKKQKCEISLSRVQRSTAYSLLQQFVGSWIVLLCFGILLNTRGAVWLCVTRD